VNFISYRLRKWLYSVIIKEKANAFPLIITEYTHFLCGIYKFHIITSFDCPPICYILNTSNNNRIEVRYDGYKEDASCCITDLTECISQREQKQDLYHLWVSFKSSKPTIGISVKALVHDIINNLSVANIKYIMLVMMTYRGVADKRIATIYKFCFCSPINKHIDENIDNIGYQNIVFILEEENTNLRNENNNIKRKLKQIITFIQ